MSAKATRGRFQSFFKLWLISNFVTEFVELVVTSLHVDNSVTLDQWDDSTHTGWKTQCWTTCCQRATAETVRGRRASLEEFGKEQYWKWMSLLYLYLLREANRDVTAAVSITSCNSMMSQRDTTCRRQIVRSQSRWYREEARLRLSVFGLTLVRVWATLELEAFLESSFCTLYAQIFKPEAVTASRAARRKRRRRRWGRSQLMVGLRRTRHESPFSIVAAGPAGCRTKTGLIWAWDDPSPRLKVEHFKRWIWKTRQKRLKTKTAGKTTWMSVSSVDQLETSWQVAFPHSQMVN